MLQNPAGTAARELCPGLQPATLQCSATCKIFSQGHPINQKIVLACHHQDSTPVLVSANGYHPRVQHTEQISNTQSSIINHQSSCSSSSFSSSLLHYLHHHHDDHHHHQRHLVVIIIIIISIITIVIYSIIKPS